MFRKTADLEKPAREPGHAHRAGFGAVDHIAAATGAMVVALGLGQLLLPVIAESFTGIESGTASQIIGLQWAVFGFLLALGGLLRTRVLTIFAGEFVALSALAALAILLLNQRGFEAVIVYCLIAAFGFASSGFARLTDKAELKREIKLLREQAASSIRQTRNPELEEPNA